MRKTCRALLGLTGVFLDSNKSSKVAQWLRLPRHTTPPGTSGKRSVPIKEAFAGVTSSGGTGREGERERERVSEREREVWQSRTCCTHCLIRNGSFASFMFPFWELKKM
jgi:hypothetical protein